MPDPTLEQTLLQKATTIGPQRHESIGPDPLGRSQLSLGMMPLAPEGFDPSLWREALESWGGRLLGHDPEPAVQVGRGLTEMMSQHGDDWMGVIGKLMNPSSESFMGGNQISPARNLADLATSYAAGKVRSLLPPVDDVLPTLMNHVLPAGQRFPLTTDPKKP